jgi:hypothetical protein
MAPTYDSIMDISDRRSDWCIFARVLRLWTVPDADVNALPLSIEMVLMDRDVSTYYFNRIYHVLIKDQEYVVLSV